LDDRISGNSDMCRDVASQYHPPPSNKYLGEGAALGGTVSAPAWRGKTCRYLVPTNDRAIQPALQRSMAKRLNAAVVEVAASHVAMLSHPQEVASLIAG
jgi:Alpha/beta hydrolase family